MLLKTFFDQRIRRVWRRVTVRSQLPRVLMYHSVHPRHPKSHRPDTFREQLLWLVENGYHVTSVTDLIKSQTLGTVAGRPMVAITFDDGYQDNALFALPILIDLGVKATFYVVASMIGEKSQSSNGGHRLYPNRHMLSARDLKSLVGAGMEVGNHTLAHEMATESFRRDPRQFVEDLRTSKRTLEQLSETSVSSFSYPNGQRGAFSDNTSESVRETGHHNAVTTIWGCLTAKTNRYLIPRCEISCDDDLPTFIDKMTGHYDYKTIIHRFSNAKRVWK